jgi:hypothetical protein
MVGLVMNRERFERRHWWPNRGYELMEVDPQLHILIAGTNFPVIVVYYSPRGYVAF